MKNLCRALPLLLSLSFGVPAQAIPIVFKHAINDCSGYYAVIDVTLNQNGSLSGQVISIGFYNNCPKDKPGKPDDGASTLIQFPESMDVDAIRKVFAQTGQATPEERAFWEKARQLAPQNTAKAFPNPSEKRQINVAFQLDTAMLSANAQGTLRVFNAQGQMVAEKQLQLAAEMQESVALPADAPAGNYFITLDAGGNGLASCQILLQ